MTHLTDDPATDAVGLGAPPSRSPDSPSATRGSPPSTPSTSPSAAESWACSARTAPARPRSCGCSPPCSLPTTATCGCSAAIPRSAPTDSRSGAGSATCRRTRSLYAAFTPFELVDYVAILKEHTDRAWRARRVRARARGGRARRPHAPQDPHALRRDAAAGGPGGGAGRRPRAAAARRARDRARPRAAARAAVPARRRCAPRHRAALDPQHRRGRGAVPAGRGHARGPDPLPRHPARAGRDRRRPGLGVRPRRGRGGPQLDDRRGPLPPRRRRRPPGAHVVPPTLDDGYLLVAAHERRTT